MAYAHGNSTPTTDGRAALSSEVLVAVWGETRAMRAALHRVHGVRRCDTELRLPGAARTPQGLRVAGDCVCRDYFVDMLAIAWTFLAEQGDRLVNPAGAVRAHVRRRRSEPLRRRRAEQGAQVKPATVRGNRYGRMLPDDYHRAVFEFLADEAGSAAPLDGETYLHERLAQRCVLEFGGSPATHLAALPEILRLIEKTCAQGPRVNAGSRAHPELVSWWEAYIQRPLGRRPRRPEALDIDTTDVAAPRRPGPDAFVVTALASAVDHVPGPRQRATLAATLTALAHHGLIPGHRATALIADAARLEFVLARVREVLTAGTPGEAPHHAGGQP